LVAAKDDPINPFRNFSSQPIDLLYLKRPRDGGNYPERETNKMDMVAYWQKNCAPYLRALLGRSERGAALVEYALLLALIAVVCIVALTTLGTQAKDKFSTVGTSIAATG
jgi:pilus assembly protein Flp/PilA